MTDAAAMAARFDLAGPVVAVEPHHTGHINDGYLVRTERRPYLLQRLHPFVFPDADAVMANVKTVTEHLRAKGEPTLTLVPTPEGSVSVRDGDGALWRMYDYVEGVHGARVRSAADAAVVGRSFGRFHRMVADLDPGRLRVSLPGFHDPARRLALLETAATDDLHGRATEAGSEVEALVDLRSLAELGRQLASAPTRVAHNDAKAANLLVDERGAAPPVVVDLDTVMPGTILWDVGDMVRSATGTAEEDAGGGGAGSAFDGERYDALLDAWLDEAGDLLTTAERDLLPVAGPVITYEQAVRFLADHLMGDLYFRVARPGQNLDRARNQLALLRSMMAARAEDVGR